MHRLTSLGDEGVETENKTKYNLPSNGNYAFGCWVN